MRIDISGRVSSSDKDKCREGNKTGAHDGERLAQATYSRSEVKAFLRRRQVSQDLSDQRVLTVARVEAGVFPDQREACVKVPRQGWGHSKVEGE